MDRELGPLRDYDAAHGADLINVLAAYLAAGGNKAEAAKSAHLARPTFYERLGHIERILGAIFARPSRGPRCTSPCSRWPPPVPTPGHVDYGTNTLHRLRRTAA